MPTSHRLTLLTLHHLQRLRRLALGRGSGECSHPHPVRRSHPLSSTRASIQRLRTKPPQTLDLRAHFSTRSSLFCSPWPFRVAEASTPRPVTLALGFVSSELPEKQRFMRGKEAKSWLRWIHFSTRHRNARPSRTIHRQRVSSADLTAKTKAAKQQRQKGNHCVRRAQAEHS